MAKMIIEPSLAETAAIQKERAWIEQNLTGINHVVTNGNKTSQRIKNINLMKQSVSLTRRPQIGAMDAKSDLTGNISAIQCIIS